MNQQPWNFARFKDCHKCSKIVKFHSPARNCFDSTSTAHLWSFSQKDELTHCVRLSSIYIASYSFLCAQRTSNTKLEPQSSLLISTKRIPYNTSKSHPASNTTKTAMSTQSSSAPTVPDHQAQLLDLALTAFLEFTEGAKNFPPHWRQDSLLLDPDKFNVIRACEGSSVDFQSFMSGQAMLVSDLTTFTTKIGSWGWWGRRFGRRDQGVRDENGSSGGRGVRGTSRRTKREKTSWIY